MSVFTEDVFEDATLGWLETLGYAILNGPYNAVGESTAEPACACTHADRRSDPNYRDIVLETRLRQALVCLNTELPAEALEDAFRKLTRTNAPSLLMRVRRELRGHPRIIFP